MKKIYFLEKKIAQVWAVTLMTNLTLSSMDGMIPNARLWLDQLWIICTDCQNLYTPLRSQLKML